MAGWHLDALRIRDDVVVLGTVEAHVDPCRAVLVATAELDELVRRGAEAAIVATPATTHRPIVERCLELGLHVLVEKPLAPKMADCEALLGAAAGAARAGIVVAVAHTERFSSAILDLRMSTPVAISTVRVGPRPQRIRDVGVLLDVAVHDVDLVRYLTKSEYTSVAVDVAGTDGGAEVEATIRARLADGSTVEHHAAWGAPNAVRQLVVDGRCIDLLAVEPGAALAAQAGAFVAACLGHGQSPRLATVADGAAAVAVLTAR